MSNNPAPPRKDYDEIETAGIVTSTVPPAASTTHMVEVVAPATLPGGYKLDADIGNGAVISVDVVRSQQSRLLCSLLCSLLCFALFLALLCSFLCFALLCEVSSHQVLRLRIASSMVGWVDHDQGQFGGHFIFFPLSVEPF